MITRFKNLAHYAQVLRASKPNKLVILAYQHMLYIYGMTLDFQTSEYNLFTKKSNVVFQISRLL